MYSSDAPCDIEKKLSNCSFYSWWPPVSEENNTHQQTCLLSGKILPCRHCHVLLCMDRGNMCSGLWHLLWNTRVLTFAPYSHVQSLYVVLWTTVAHICYAMCLHKYIHRSAVLTESSAFSGCTLSWLSGSLKYRSHLVFILQIHMAPHCVSGELYKSILTSYD